MAIDIEFLNRVRAARDAVLRAVRSGGDPVQVTLHPLWVARFEALNEHNLYNVVGRHGDAVRFSGVPVSDGTDEREAVVHFSDGSTKIQELTAP